MNRLPSYRRPVIRLKARMARACRQCDEFNRDHGVGTPVRYFPLRGESQAVDTRTRSHAWVLPCGEAVVLIEGKAGGVSLDHLQVVQEAAP